jgi:hypothetical protein
MRLGALLVSIIGALAFTASPALAADPPAWHTAFPATEGSPADGVSCGTITFCMVVGSTIAVEDDGPVYETIQDPNGLSAVSCAPGSHFCVAGDIDGRALTFSGGEFGDVDPVAGDHEFLSVSCPAVERCMAITHSFGTTPYFMIYKLDDGGWDAGTELSASGISGSSQPRVACATEDSCVVVANTDGDVDGERYWTYHGSGWTLAGSAIPSRPVGDTTVSLTCSRTNFCLSTSKDGDASRFDGTTWTTQHIDSHGINDLASSCFGTVCRAIDLDDHAYETSNGTTWSSETNIRAATNFSGASSMSCPSAATCVASNGTGDTTTYGLSIVPRTPPVITGTGAVGATLTISTHSSIDNPNAWFFPEWWRCDNPGSTCTQIPDEHDDTYTLTGDDVGKYIDVLEGTGIGLDEELFRQRSNHIAVPGPASPPPSSGSPPDATGDSSGAGSAGAPKRRAPRLAKTSTNRKGRVTLSLTCPAHGARCTGTVRLTFKSAKKKRKTAGSAHYSVAAGRKGKATVKLKPAARKLLRSRHSLSVVLTIKPAGAKATTRKLKLKFPR